MNQPFKSADLVERLAQRIDLNAATTPEGVADVVPQFADRRPEPSAPEPSVEVTSPLIARLETPQTRNPAAEPAAAGAVALDLETLSKRGYLTPQSPHSLLAEEYRIIKRPLLRAAFGPDRRAGDRDHVLLVTSPRPAEGKTFTSINLAMSIASEHECHVLLVDGDSRQRGLSQALGLAEHKGLMDLLIDHTSSLQNLILRTNIPRLSVLTAGQSARFPTELLSSQRMQAIMEEMTRRYPDRMIIFDSPPVLAASEPGVLAGYAGQVIMIALAGETPKQAVSESLTLLNACPNINVILNRVRLSAGSNRFGDYGYYGAPQTTQTLNG